MKVHYLLKGKLIGQGEIEVPAQSLALFCSSCGDIWGRVWVEADTAWLVESVPCEKHAASGVPDWGRWPGSFLNPLISQMKTGWDGLPTTVERVPDSVVEREFQLCLTYLDKEIGNETSETTSNP